MKLQPTLIIKPDIRTLKKIQFLRVEAWEDTGLISKDDYPNGLYDQLDNDAFHWITLDNDAVIQAARVNILDDINQIPYSSLFSSVTLPTLRPFAHISRHVIKREYQGFGLSTKMDKIRLEFIEQKGIKLTIAWARGFRVNKLLEYGFEITGRADISNFDIKDPEIKIMHKINT